MLIRNLTDNSFLIFFSQSMRYPKVIYEYVLDPDDTYQGLQTWKGSVLISVTRFYLSKHPDVVNRFFKVTPVSMI